jgi:hypothetical protein
LWRNDPGESSLINLGVTPGSRRVFYRVPAGNEV